MKHKKDVGEDKGAYF